MVWCTVCVCTAHARNLLSQSSTDQRKNCICIETLSTKFACACIVCSLLFFFISEWISSGMHTAHNNSASLLFYCFFFFFCYSILLWIHRYPLHRSGSFILLMVCFDFYHAIMFSVSLVARLQNIESTV